jgi:hypothetical protein
MDRQARTLIERRRPRVVLRRFVERTGNRLRSCLGRRQHPEIKVHGLLRSGTNYLEALLRRNFHVCCLAPSEGGWKHGRCEGAAGRRYVFLVKDPYAWLVSFRNWERLHERTRTVDIAQFAGEALTHERLRRAWDVDTPVQAWNRSLRGWLDRDGAGDALFLRYEDLIRDSAEELARIGERFGLTARRSRPADIRSRADTWTTPNPRTPLDVAYYRHEKYLEEFDERARSLLRRELDRELIARFDYRIH